jgi:xylose dehydrogenase (NAD/NADP)
MVRVPEAANVTCCCFGGEKMDTLFITTATAFVPDGKQQVNGGAVFKVKMPGGFSGIPETPFADGAAPSLKFGVMSTAAITAKTLPGMTTVVAVGSRDAAKATKFIADNAAKTKGGFVGEGMTYDELVVHPDVEAIYCPLPTGLRNDWIRKAVAAGKHIYSEKPMGGTVAELKALLDACAAKGLQFMDGTMWYHSKRTRAIEALLASGELGPLKSANASFTFHFPDQEWLDGGNGRTDKSREPMGCLGDQGWYPLSAILWAFQWELPTHVMATSTTFNKIDTIVACSGVLFFEGGRVATFDCGCTAAHRSQYEIVCELGTVRVDDLVGGQGRSGDFSAYFVPYVGSGRYTKGDVMGKDEVVEVEECDHVDALVEDFTACVNRSKAGGAPDPDWPRRSLAMHAVMCAVFESANNSGARAEVAKV